MSSNVFLANALGLSGANVTAIKKRDQQSEATPVPRGSTVPLSAGADAFAFRNHGIAELFRGKKANR